MDVDEHERQALVDEQRTGRGRASAMLVERPVGPRWKDGEQGFSGRWGGARCGARLAQEPLR